MSTSGSEKPLYTPFEAPYRLSMGLLALPADEWLEIDDDWPDDLREKRRLLAQRRDDVFRETPGSEPAQTETLDAVLGFLRDHAPDRIRCEQDTLRLPALNESWSLCRPGIPALDLAARLVQEDLCLMERRAGDGAWCLTAASVCFPTRWSLAEKIGQPLDAIHAPVPGFDRRLARPVARFFDHLKVARPVWRLNWSLLDDPGLFQPKGHGRTARNPRISAENAGERVTLRVERQTLRRLPQSDAIVFTIRIHRWPLARLLSRPEAARLMLESLATMPDDLHRYKSMRLFDDAVRGYLEANLAA